ncbi:ABC transporter ATP-binding protein [Alkalihalobacterium bogoriense]|uniref:ABC transporter ATP-binding protein n=1 Tax=Alkalihalobacterium bogoriense TaxID=246272 RepID=UPI000479E4CA|nr:ABC transporter ATP-binding protein [Alkalihalobacterium bogoriense]
MKKAFIKLLRLFNKKEKKKLILIFFLMIIAAFFETVGIGLIVPFVSVVTNPEIIQEQRALSIVYEYFNFQSTASFTFFLAVLLLSIYIIKNLYLLLFYYIQNRVVLNQQVKLSRNLFQEYLSKPYLFHIQQNSALLLRNVNEEVPKVFQGIVMSSFYLITEFLVIICILILLLTVAPLATLTATLLLGGSVFLFFKFFRKKVSRLGKEQQEVTGKMIKWVNQGLGASKEVKVTGKELFFVNAYTKYSQISANNLRFKNMLEHAPRLFIETIVVTVVLITMVIIIFQGTNTSNLLATLALFAMAAFRLMPSINRVISMVNTIRYSQPALSIVYRDLYEGVYTNNLLLDKKENKGLIEKTSYKHSIELKNVSFKYPLQNTASLKEINLQIPIGSSVGIVGESGAGKTTLVDIILGLLKPNKGEILVDGLLLDTQLSFWQKNIGYIPQSIFLSDESIRSNIAFGIDKDKIDESAVWKALEQAQLMDYVKELPEQLNTIVGERGVRLSGGQRQRIGIARALYHDPQIIFMDEATSALDNQTENEVMKAVYGLTGNKTLIIIAHRLSTIEKCDIVFTLNKGKLISSQYKDKLSIM